MVGPGMGVCAITSWQQYRDSGMMGKEWAGGNRVPPTPARFGLTFVGRARFLCVVPVGRRSLCGLCVHALRRWDLLHIDWYMIQHNSI